MQQELQYLADLERKLIVMIQHENHKNQSPSLDNFTRRTGRSAEDVQATIKKLVQQNWLTVEDKQLKVVKELLSNDN